MLFKLSSLFHGLTLKLVFKHFTRAEVDVQEMQNDL